MDVHNPVRRVSATERKKRAADVKNKNEQPDVEPISVGSFQEKKILNTASCRNTFMATSEIFEKTLNQLIIDNDEEIYETLLKLQNIIGAKLLTYKCASEGTNENADNMFPTQNLTSRNLLACTRSLCSLGPSSLEFLLEDKAYKKFLKNVNCPFCYKVEENKIKLIKHLDENCKPLISNEIEERHFIPFSAFQILPNNTIKCNICRNSVLKNLQYFFLHLSNKVHRSEYAKALKMKKYTEFLYCSCCKILVPNNYTQLDLHMNHKTHKSRSDLAPQKNLELFKNADCVYLKSKKFKCLICPSNVPYSHVKDVLKHFENQNHGNELKNRMFPKVFCEVCMKDLPIIKILSHLSSDEHIEIEKIAALQEQYETCYYCGFVCSSLRELSVHMMTQCKEIASIRERNVKLRKLCNTDIKSKPKEEKSETSVSKSNMPTEGKNTKKGLHIIVKDNTNVLQIYKYFKKFGEITRVEIYKDKNVLIQFQDASSVENVLLLHDVIHINGVKMEITTDELQIKPAKAKKKLEKGINLEEKHLLETSDEDQSRSRSETTETQQVQHAKLEELFQRVSHHLSNTTEIFDSGLEEKILEDCSEILGPNRKYSVIGYAGTRLSFPVEMMDLYCDMGEEYNAAHPDNFHFQENLIKQLYIKLCNTSKWEAVNSCFKSAFPYIRCTHVATQKSCRLIIAPSAKLLTDMLSCCIEKVDVARNFCMIVRFWFTVHKLKIGQLDFVIISLLIFFLINKCTVVNVFEICNVPNASFLFLAKLSEYSGFKQLDLKTKSPGNMSNVVEVFQEFLAFLCRFNFTRDMIVLPLDFRVPREVIDNEGLHMFFKSFDLNELRNSAMCIIDPLLNVNLTRDISHDDLESLLEAARNTLKNTG